ncbi:hypothetical protein [Roseibium alexandrii]|uniref:hypothetical protein n=1 Tax=Roseibium alexandrii TaxID=388408 RepID=UPI00375271C8
MINSSPSETARLYCVHTIVWQSIVIDVWHMRGWVPGMDHIEVRSQDSALLPTTETGYKSLFVPSADDHITSDPAAYVLAWLDHAASSEEWKDRAAERAQLSLF